MRAILVGARLPYDQFEEARNWLASLAQRCQWLATYASNVQCEPVAALRILLIEVLPLTIIGKTGCPTCETRSTTDEPDLEPSTGRKRMKQDMELEKVGMQLNETEGQVERRENEEMIVPANPEVATGAMDEAPSQTKEATGQHERCLDRRRQSASWKPGSSDWQSIKELNRWTHFCSWDTPSPTGLEQSLDDRGQHSCCGRHESSDSRRSHDWGASAKGATEYGQRLRRPAAFPQGDTRLTERRKRKRICICDSCGVRIAFGSRATGFDGHFVNDIWRSTRPFHELYDEWKKGEIDATWWCSMCHKRSSGADLNETRRVLGIQSRAVSRMARAAAWRASG